MSGDGGVSGLVDIDGGQCARCRRADVSGDGCYGGSMDRDGGSALIAVELTCLATSETAAVCWLQAIGLVWRRRWRWIGGQRRRQCALCSRADVSSGDGNRGGSLDRDGGSVLVAVELTCLATAAAVDRWTETAAVPLLQSN